MLDRIRSLAKEYTGLERTLEDPTVFSDHQAIAKIRKRMREIEPAFKLLWEYEKCAEAVRTVSQVGDDSELRALAEEEAREARENIPKIEEEMRLYLLPKDPDDTRNVMLEVRAGAGGEEAGLFAAELLRMYLRYAEMRGWKTELVDKADADAGGIKEAVSRIVGDGAYGVLKYESGVHRVQRIPATEAKGRIHTSTATVAVLPEAGEVEVEIRPEDLRIDTFRSSGAGGQKVNKTESAIRITHIPTGLVVACQSERSQHQNRDLAMQLLRSRLYTVEQERLHKERGEIRRGMVGTGDRSEKIRTYNFPQDRVTDHRLERNFSNIQGMMDGNIGSLIDALKAKEKEEQLRS